MEELGNIAVFLPVRQEVRFRTSMCLEKIKYIRWLIFHVLMA